MTPPHGAASIVPADGKSPAAVMRSIADAESHGQTSRFVTVVTANNRYVFTPHDLIVKTKNSVLVEAYSRLYVFPLIGTTISYSGSSAPVGFDGIPLVSADELDAHIAQHNGKPDAVLNAVPGKKDVCSDCAVILGGRQASSRQNKWAGLQDAWQVHPDYAAPTTWAESSSADGHVAAKSPSNDPPYPQIGSVSTTYVYLPYGQFLYAYNYHSTGGYYVGAQPPAVPCDQIGPDATGVVDNLGQSNAKVKALESKIANYNASVVNNGGSNLAQIPIKYGPILDKNGNATTFAARANIDYTNPANDSIEWDAAAVATAQANGQDPVQILYHELDHILNSLKNPDPNGSFLRRVPIPGDANFPANGMATMTIGGSTFTFNLNINAQMLAYEHAVVHNDLVGAFASDKTGALQSAVQGIPRTDANGKAQATLDKNGAAAFAQTNKTATAAVSTPPSDWDYASAGACTTTASFKRKVSSVVSSGARSTRGDGEYFDGTTAQYVDYSDYSPGA